MKVLNPIPDEMPDPDCGACGGEGRPQSPAHKLLADEWSNEACPDCWQKEADE